MRGAPARSGLDRAHMRISSSICLAIFTKVDRTSMAVSLEAARAACSITA
jgi:hypothetical protein